LSSEAKQNEMPITHEKIINGSGIMDHLVKVNLFTCSVTELNFQEQSGILSAI